MSLTPHSAKSNGVCTDSGSVYLTLEEVGGFDLDDADRDGDPATGVDNRLGRSSVFVATLNAFIADFIAHGEYVQLMTLVGLDDPRDDEALAVHLFPGQAPECTATASPPWLEAPGAPIVRRADAFDGCAPPGVMRAGGTPGLGLNARRRRADHGGMVQAPTQRDSSMSW